MKAFIALFILCLAVGVALTIRASMTFHPRPPLHGDISFAISPRDEVVFNAVGEGGRDLFMLDLTTLRVTRIEKTPDYEVDPCFSPDGKTLAYAAGQPGDRADHIFVRSLDGGTATQLTRGDTNDSEPVYSPDGSFIAFTRDKVYNWGGLAANWGTTGVICVVKADGSSLRQITRDGTFAIAPRFSRDGKTIFYYDDAGKMYAVDAGGSESAKPIKDVDALVASARPSPASGLVTFSWGESGSSSYGICVAQADGTARRQLPDPEWTNARPAFRSDGKRIVFLLEDWLGSHEVERSLWEVSVDGGKAHQLAGSNLFDDPLHWRPGKSK